ncbi:hypothetical protein HKX48_000059 [Thoreauomyces humboldtii]|nr:hypothetical protein HKX48_000059 [Thoreauomyces humboldtii]
MTYRNVSENEGSLVAAEHEITHEQGSQEQDFSQPGHPTAIIDATFSSKSSTSVSEPLERETWTPPSAVPGILARAATLAAVAVAGPAFAKKASGGGAGSVLHRLRTFLVQQHQVKRLGSQVNPTTKSVAIVARKQLEGTHLPPGRAQKTQMLRVMHAREDAERYRRPTSELTQDYFAPRPADVAGWNTMIEEKIGQAIRSGQLDDLPGSGKPLDLTSGANAFTARSTFYMNRLAKAQGHQPEWVELGCEVEEDLKTMREDARRIWLSGAWGRGGQYYGLRRAEVQKWVTVRARDINGKVARFNMLVPRGVPHRKRVDIEQEVLDSRAQEP